MFLSNTGNFQTWFDETMHVIHQMSLACNLVISHSRQVSPKAISPLLNKWKNFIIFEHPAHCMLDMLQWVLKIHIYMNCSSYVVSTGKIRDMSPSWKERTLIPMFIYGIVKFSVNARESMHWLKTPNKYWWY